MGFRISAVRRLGLIVLLVASWTAFVAIAPQVLSRLWTFPSWQSFLAHVDGIEVAKHLAESYSSPPIRTALPDQAGADPARPTPAIIVPTLNSSATPQTAPRSGNDTSCGPSRFSVGQVVIVDLASTSPGASTVISALTEPGGTVVDSDADPGAQLSIIAGPVCLFVKRYDQYVRYWQVAFTNRSRRFIPQSWVAESLREGSYLNYLLCPASQPDC